MEEVWLTFEDKLINWVNGEEGTFYKFEAIKGNIGFPQVNDHVLGEWAKSLIFSFVHDDSIDIKVVASYWLNKIFTQERNSYIRWRNGYDEEESSPISDGEESSSISDEKESPSIFKRWQKLRSSFCRGFPDLSFSVSDEVREYLLEIGLIGEEEEDTDTENSQESQERADFRLKYDRYISNIDIFFESLKTIKVRELKAFFDKSFAKSNVTLKNFFDDCTAIVPERKGERGWKYNNIKNFNTR